MINLVTIKEVRSQAILLHKVNDKEFCDKITEKLLKQITKLVS